MFERILVPLDGSEFSESAIEPAALIAKKFEGELILLRVITLEQSATLLASAETIGYAAAPEPDRRLWEDVGGYLNSIRGQWLKAGVDIRTAAMKGEPAQLIVSVAESEKADLIVMSTHGRSGLARLLYGSVTEAVLRGANVPVLLIPIFPSKKRPNTNNLPDAGRPLDTGRR